MRTLRRVVIAFVGVACLAAFGLPSFAKNGDDWPLKKRLAKTQSHGFQKGLRRQQRGAFQFFYDERDFYRLRKGKNRDFYLYQEPGRRDLFQQRPNKLADKGRKPRRNVDPQPGRPKSPDDGFGAYRPIELVALSDPKLEAAIPNQVLASTLLHELRQPKAAVRVTARQKDAIINFYRRRNFDPLWVSSEGPTDKAKRVAGLLAKAEEEGLTASDYLPPALGSFSLEASRPNLDVVSLVRFDIGLTAMALRYGEHLHSGRIVPKRLSGYYDIEPPVLDLAQTLNEFSLRPQPELHLSSLAPSHPAYSAMRASLAAFRKDGGRSEAILAGKRVKPGEYDPRVPLIRARLVELGYLRPDDANAWMVSPAKAGPDAREGTLDKALSRALTALQAASKIKQTGAIDNATVASLQAERGSAETLVLNMERLRWLPRELGQRHVLVNQASFELNLIDGESIVWSTKVIVGKPETQTAVFTDEMETVVLNPYWGVPQSIIRYEMMPRLAKDRRYLDRQGFQVVDARGRQVSARSVNWWSYAGEIPFGVLQPPGDDNALGRVKFLFPNDHDIYMHDTPTKELFAEPVRAFSHGCVRVENPRKFAEHVLGWERRRIDDLIATDQNREIPLDRRLPVHLNYFTAWPGKSGNVAFYSDIYERDTRLAKALDTIARATQ